MDEPKQPEFYWTISSSGEGYLNEKKSKFYSFAYPVETVADALSMVDTLRKKYYDARHVCWAYRVGKQEMQSRMNDDGEPSSTAGRPIMGQILSRELTDVIVLVVRYFGGVKLGTSGLIQAYKDAAALALEAVKIVKIELQREYQLSFPFGEIHTVMRLCSLYAVELLRNDSDTAGYQQFVRVSEASAEAFEKEMRQLYFLDYKRIS